MGHAEYLLFDAVVLVPLLAIALLRPRWFAGGWGPALRATAWASVPFIAWDASVVGRHWGFNEAYVFGARLLGLPLEEWGFFLVVPLACLVTWELALSAARARPSPRLRWAPWAVVALALPSAVAWSTGREYTGAALLALSLAAVADLGVGTGVLTMPRGWALLLCVVGFTTVFNGYLTGRPVVLYDLRYQLPLHLGPIPVEDYGFGLALVLLATSLYQRARGRRVRPSWLGLLIARRLGGFKHAVEVPNAGLPERVAAPRTVAVIGGGLAGLSAAELLSRRGFQVTLFEKNSYLGGKIGAWREAASDGAQVHVEHGFHAFFRHYYNLNDWLEAVGVKPRLKAIEDYLILSADGRSYRFAGVETTPALNLLALKGRGLYRWRDVMNPETGQRLEAFLRYHPVETPRALDGVSFADYARDAKLPPALKLVFTTFARAFFADEARISMAELVRSFHFYYLSHDHGLLYDYLDGAYSSALLEPLAARLTAQGVTLKLGTAVGRLTLEGTRYGVDGEPFDAVVLGCDVGAAKRLFTASAGMSVAAPALSQALAGLKSGQRYAVLRVWANAPVGGGELPVFVATERTRALDAFAFVDRTDETARAWAREHSGSVVELHCYAVPDELPNEQVAAAMELELERYLPGFRSSQVTRRHLQVRDDFTAFHLGLAAGRPGVETELPGLVLAGDWVALPFPSMLLETAHTTGRLAANALCRRAGVRTFPVWSVPPRGLLPPRALPGGRR